MRMLVDFSLTLVVVVAVVVVEVGGVGAAAVGADDESCSRVTRCKDDGPIVRFPFRLKGHQPDYCGYQQQPGFDLYCNGKQTMMEFQSCLNTSLKGQQQLCFFIKASVEQINYTSQLLLMKSYTLTTPPALFPHVSSSSAAASPFKFSDFPFNNYVGDGSDLTLLSCSKVEKLLSEWEANTLSPNFIRHGEEAIVILSGLFTYDVPITSCSLMFNFSYIPYEFLVYNKYPWQPYSNLWLNWSRPDCGKCEAKGDYCMLNNNNATAACFTPRQQPTSTVGGHHLSIKSLLAQPQGIIPSVSVIVLVMVSALYYVIRSNKRKKEDQLKIEKFMEDYKAMKPTRYSYADIKKVARNFSNSLGQGGYGSVYKGQISNELVVAVKVLNSDPKANGEDFINEVGTIGRIHHVNVVRLVGYCADGCNRALVYEFQPNKSLEKFVCSGGNQRSNFLGWEKMQEIALGVAKGIEYLHQGCAQQILHFDIKPHNILLDENFNPKISDFGLAKLCSKDQSAISMTMARGTIGYIAPEVFSRNFGKVSAKSDVYSFGMLLLEMVGARNNNAGENNSESYFPEWIFHQLEQGGEVAIQIEKENDSNIARKLTVVGLWCIGWHPVDRPSMKHVIQMLEREECPEMPPNPFSSTTTSANARPFAFELEAISESE